MEKKIIILTKSKKHSGYCVAGIDYETGEWIRLVSSDSETEGAVPWENLQYSNGETLEVYDIIMCRLLRKCGTIVQPENCLYDETVKWEKVGKSNFDEVIKIHGYDSVDYVFENEDTKLPADWIFSGNPSLCLLKVKDASIWVKTFEDKKISLNFTYDDIQYKYMSISQIDLLNYYKNKTDDSYPLGTVTVVFSLTDKYYWNGKYYKVVAQILY
jgi:hypothetical protein